MNRRQLDALLRNELYAFIEKVFCEVSSVTTYLSNWHIELMADYLTQCYRGEINRLIINVPPRSMKSICASIAFPAWVLGLDPTCKIVCASYSNELSVKLARDCKHVMMRNWYKRIFPGTRLSRSGEMDLETSRKGTRYATSLGGSLTGRGGDIIILDDPIKPEDCLSTTVRKKTNDSYGSTLYSRLNSKSDGVVIIIMQRLHVDDLVAHVLAKDDWTVLSIPAIAEEEQTYRFSDNTEIHRDIGDVLHPERESLETLNQIKDTIGNYNFSAQYLQNPIPPEGNLVRRIWFKYYDQPYTPRQGDYIVQSWDTATKESELANYSVCLTFLVRDNQYFLLDVLRKKLDFPDLYKAVLEQAQKYHVKNILIEDKSSGTQLIQSLRRVPHVGVPSPNIVTPSKDKVIRMAGESLKIEQGRLSLLRNAPWLDDFEHEVLAFPYGAQDDQVDALSQFLGWVDSRPRVIVKQLIGL